MYHSANVGTDTSSSGDSLRDAVRINFPTKSSLEMAACAFLNPLPGRNT